MHRALGDESSCCESQAILEDGLTLYRKLCGRVWRRDSKGPRQQICFMRKE